MSLVVQINKDLILAMKAKDETKLRAIRAIKSAFLLAGTESGNKEISDEIAMKAMQKMAKQRKDSLEIFTKEGRVDLAIKEKEELDIIATYLPQAMSEEAVGMVLKALIAETGVTSMKEVGKIMPLAMKTLAGKADGKIISEVLKTLLIS
ncbi:MAG: GatB/YqeY domain-containing protein [Bacteroidetes bacterium]|nr:GatB/YqeY domain-containing protein [Bacteroidota bacterium]